jgi:hypothetical protein
MHTWQSLGLLVGGVSAIGQVPIIDFDNGEGGLLLGNAAQAVRIYLSSDEWPGVTRAAKDLATDFGRVTGLNGTVVNSTDATLESGVIIVGTLGHSSIIDDLVSRDMLNVSSIEGQWESFQSQVVRNPVEGIAEALVIAGQYRQLEGRYGPLTVNR